MDYLEYESFLENDNKEKIVEFLNAYNDWIKAQLRCGALIFPPDDYYYIWLGQ